MNKNVGLKLSTIALAVVLASCGGGGSEGYYNQEGSSNNSGGSDNAGNIEEVQSLEISSIKLNDTSGKETQLVSALGVVATVKVTDGKGKPVGGALVSFGGENMTFSTTNSAVFTNADGEAVIGITPTDSNITGAYLLAVNANLNDINATKSKNVSFVKTDIVIDSFKAASSSLESGGSTLLTLLIKDTEGNYQNNQQVSFTAGCGTFSNPTVSSSSEGNVSNT